jgi:hypothetical protein
MSEILNHPTEQQMQGFLKKAQHERREAFAFFFRSLRLALGSGKGASQPLQGNPEAWANVAAKDGTSAPTADIETVLAAKLRVSATDA